MQFGVHLPQYGKAASPESISAAARQAEQLGFRDVWVSDHLVFPVGQFHPSPYLFDPLLTLAWAGAATSTVGLGTSVLVPPQYGPLALANSLASLDALTGGRLTVAVGVGWSEKEFEALGYDFHDRGSRLDEILEVLHLAWTQDVIEYSGKHYQISGIKVLPKPARPIPVWIGGISEPAFRRAARTGDGFHTIALKPEDAASVVARIRRDHPDPETYPFSLRIDGWDPQGMDPDDIRRELETFEAAGVQHVVAALVQRDAASWLHSVELLADVLRLHQS